MKETAEYYPVNWVDGMKINKNHFIEQENAQRFEAHELCSISLSPTKYGLIPAKSSQDNFKVAISVDNQKMAKVTVMKCNAVTLSGSIINIPFQKSGGANEPGTVQLQFNLADYTNEPTLWIFLFVHPFEREPAGEPDFSENPPRIKYSFPSYSIGVSTNAQFNQSIKNTYGIPIGKLLITAADVRLDENYIPPCVCVEANEDLKSLNLDIEKFLGELEIRCSLIVQKVYKKNQQNELSELVQFLCDRMLTYIGPAIIDLRWTYSYESPVKLFGLLSTLARIIKNAIDLRIGSGREEMMNYLCEWCELSQGELDSLLSSVASLKYVHHDVNTLIPSTVKFVQTINKLFETLSKLDYIGKRKESGIFVKEEKNEINDPGKARRRFFG
jgi:hypothetical protein